MSGETPPDESKVFNDPIHGHIELHPLMVKIIDTPQFQRLRYIKQMGGKYYVFPGACHNRFEHSIGVGYLAGELVEIIQKKQPKLGIDPKDVLCVKIAGLCHDLGHGPFSHLFESFIRRVRPEKSKWKHEEASLKMFRHLIEVNKLKEDMKSKYNLEENDLKFIEELIEGKKECTTRPPEKWFLAEIVANHITEVDVDKWDYFARDCHGLGIANNFDMRRYMAFVRVIPVEGRNQICVRDKEVHSLYEMFHARYTLHRRACLHKTAIAVEEMLIEALVSANDHLSIPVNDTKRHYSVKMSEAIDDMHAYTRLTDNIVSLILFDQNPDLKKAKDLLTRIEKRQLYKLVHHIPWENETPDTDKVRELIKQIKPDSTCPELTAEDLWPVVVTFDYGMKENNPVDAMRFYRKCAPDTPIKLTKNEVSQMLPETFSEKELRLYYTKQLTDKSTQQQELQAAKE